MHRFEHVCMQQLAIHKADQAWRVEVCACLGQARAMKVRLHLQPEAKLSLMDGDQMRRVSRQLFCMSDAGWLAVQLERFGVAHGVAWLTFAFAALALPGLHALGS